MRKLIIWYISSLAILLIMFFVLIYFSAKANLKSEISLAEIWSLFLLSLPIIFKNTIIYIFALVPFLLSLLIKSLKKDIHKNGTRALLKGLLLKVFIPLASIWLIGKGINYYRFQESFAYVWDASVENQTDKIKDFYALDGKQRGIHVFDLRSDTTDLEILKTNNFEWITLVPFISQEEYNTPSLRSGVSLIDNYDPYTKWMKVRKWVDRYGFKVMFKPHITLLDPSNGIWRSDIKMTSEEDWDLWFKQYETYILSCAEIAEKLNFEQFCIGTELNTSIITKPEKWFTLIEKVRSVYSGSLTYAANWNDDLLGTKIWQELDFIGLQAYFPIAEHKNPSLQELEQGWQKHSRTLEELHEKFQKPILFTEIGYKTTTDAAVTPWEWNTFSNQFYKKVSKKNQALCYQAFFNTIWTQPWFVGVHIWEWQTQGTSNGNNNAFTVEGKPALNVISKGFYMRSN